jgi:hypothetical protein
MKKASILLLGIFALATSALAREDFQINQIKVNFPNTPQIVFGGAPAKPFSPQAWLEVEVEFKSNVDFTEELTFQYYIYLDTTKCLVGTVSHVNVPKGNSLWSVMYVSPPALALLSKGKFSKNVQEVTVQILNKGEVVAEKSLKGTQGQWWTKVDQTTGMVLNKNETPFAPLYWDHYVEIKPGAH